MYVVGNEVVDSCLEVLNGGRSIRYLNHTLIALIPKIDKPKHVTQFRPIALCNVIYKVVSKTIANRFKSVLPAVISETQSAFVPKRNITDNILVAFESTFSMCKRCSSEDSSMALKLDMVKAYARVEWCFSEKMMQQLGFDSRFVSLILDCISSFLLYPIPLSVKGGLLVRLFLSVVSVKEIHYLHIFFCCVLKDLHI